MNDKQLIQLAKEYCVHYHNGVYRKGSNKPFSEHPIEVARILDRFGYSDVTTQCIALLHDTVEDTTLVPKEIKSRFGFQIAFGVGILSKNTIDDDTYKFLSYAISDIDWKSVSKNDLYKARLVHATKEVRRIKIADTIDNTRDLTVLDKGGIERKIRDAQELYIPLGKIIAPIMVKELEGNISNYLDSLTR
jgi:GTP diphosphokinase / guanosine-3',5'-bis(diphosphate) 3'-diphosphatase